MKHEESDRDYSFWFTEIIFYIIKYILIIDKKKCVFSLEKIGKNY